MQSKSKKDFVQVQMRIVNIHETKFYLDDRVLSMDLLDVTKLNLELGCDFKIAEADNLLSIVLTSSYKYSFDGIEQAIVTLSVNNVFEINNITEYLELEGEIINDKANIIPQVLNVIVGTMRGVLSVKVAGTILSKFPVPLIDSASLLSIVSYNK